MSNTRKLPRPGLQGDYRGTCTLCLRATDTAIGFEGEAEYLIAGLIWLGVENEVAYRMVSEEFGCDPGMVPTGRHCLYVRLCAKCAAEGGYPDPKLWVVGGTVPTARQP